MSFLKDLVLSQPIKHIFLKKGEIINIILLSFVFFGLYIFLFSKPSKPIIIID